MLLRAFWMVAWLMPELKTQTFGPKGELSAPGHIDEAGSAAGLAVAPLAGTKANPAPAASAARNTTGRRSQRPARPVLMGLKGSMGTPSLERHLAPRPSTRHRPPATSVTYAAAC